MKPFIIVFLLLLNGIAHAQSSEPVKSGIFGGNGTDAPKIELKEDHTFYYLDSTRQKKPIEFIGTWSIDDGKLTLNTSEVVSRKAMTSFKVLREGKCIQATKGFAFYTFCNCRD